MRKFYSKTVFVLLVAIFLTGSVLFSQTPSRPWENPNSGFADTPKNQSTTADNGGYDRIEKVTESSGGTFDNGTKVSGEGNSQHKSFVDGFLNSAATKITGVNGAASAWSWSKSWKVGPNGKPMEVKESFHEGSLKFTGQKDPKTNNSPPTTSVPQTVQNPPVNTGSVPSNTNAPKTPIAGTPPPSSGSGAPPSSSSGSPAGAPAASAKAPAPAPSPGIDIAPQKKSTELPPKMVALAIEDQRSHLEQQFKSYENGLQTKAQPIPEDVRTKIGLELGEGLKREEVSVVVKDNINEKEFPNGTFPSNYLHVFRIPSQDKYYVSVIHTPSLTNIPEEKLRVVIPVYKLDFESRTITTSHTRTQGGDFHGQNPANGGSGNNFSGADSSPPSSNQYSSVKTGGSNSSSGGGFSTSGPPVDLSDLYTDPGAPSQMVAITGARRQGYQTGPAGSADGQNPADSNIRGGQSNSGDAAANNGSQNQGGQNQRNSSTLGHNSGSVNPRIQNGVTGSGMSQGNGRDGNSNSNGSSMPVSGSPSGQNGNNAANQPSNQNFASLPRGANYGNSNGSSHGSTQSGQYSANSSANSAGVSNQFNQGQNSDSASSDSQANFDQAGSSPDEASNGVSDSNANPRAGDPGDSQNPTLSVSGAPALPPTSREFMASLYLKDSASEVGQSFDFLDFPFQTAKSINQNSQLSFSVDLSKKVDRDSVVVVVYDGSEKVEIPLQSLNGNVFQHLFPKPTLEAYVWIYGNSDKSQFSFKVAIPVTENYKEKP